IVTPLWVAPPGSVSVTFPLEPEVVTSLPAVPEATVSEVECAVSSLTETLTFFGHTFTSRTFLTTVAHFFFGGAAGAGELEREEGEIRRQINGAGRGEVVAPARRLLQRGALLRSRPALVGAGAGALTKRRPDGRSSLGEREAGERRDGPKRVHLPVACGADHRRPPAGFDLEHLVGCD